MKLAKMSLAAAVLLGASAFAIENVKVSGDAKLFYSTNDQGTGVDLFDKGSSAADTALRLGVTADLLKNVSMGATAYAVSTLGLENNLVSNTWTGAHGVANPASGVDDAAWMGELWLAGTVGKTTAKVGRMELDTPLAFSEKWSVVPNTFDAAVLINQDIPDTTLVGAWVGKGNGYNVGQGSVATIGYANAPAVGMDGIMGAGAKFGTFVEKGAYAAAIVNNSFKPLTAQGWYYNVLDVADAYWLQADINCQLVKGVKIGAQYADISPKGLLNGVKDSEAYALKLAYEGVENLKVSAAYSETDKDGVLKIANVATNNLGAAQSKLYTEAWWNYGFVGAPDTDSWNVSAEYDVKNIAKVGAYYTNADNGAAGNAGDMEEITVTASRSFGPLDATLAYINTELNGGNDFNTVQAYLTLNF